MSGGPCTIPGCPHQAVGRLGLCPGHLATTGAAELSSGGSGWLSRALGGVLRVVNEQAAANQVNELVGAAAARLSRPRSAPSAPPEPREAALRWLRSLGLRTAGDVPTADEVGSFRKAAARMFHADSGQGSVDPEMMGRINAACDEVLR